MKLGIVAPCYNEHEVLAESAGRRRNAAGH